MLSFIKRPTGFTVTYLLINVILNGIFKSGALIFKQSWITVIGALLLIAFTFFYAIANEALLSKKFISLSSKYIATCAFVLLVGASIAAVYNNHAASQEMPQFLLLLITLSLTVIMAAICYALIYLSIRLGNWLASFVVKSNMVL